MHPLIKKLQHTQHLEYDEWVELIESRNSIDRCELYTISEKIRQSYYGNKVYLRGLIEFSNFCKNNCYYCGIRRSNYNLNRYRLTEEQILDCCRRGHKLGFKTFVLQSGEDFTYGTYKIADLVRAIKTEFPDSAVTLSLGERDKFEYLEWYKAGADRYLLRHETADYAHYRSLHPREMSLSNRMQSLLDLKSIGYQVGAGFMVGSPNQSSLTLASDMLFLERFQPHMVGIGPFIPHSETPFKNKEPGTLYDTLFFLSVTRILLPKVLLPATTALGTIHPLGQELAIKLGANVLMPNLTPLDHRNDYLLYDNKAGTNDEAEKFQKKITESLKNINYEVVSDRGDSLLPTEENINEVNLTM